MLFLCAADAISGAGMCRGNALNSRSLRVVRQGGMIVFSGYGAQANGPGFSPHSMPAHPVATSEKIV
jgi:hypothetical protein